jgi:ADP-ribose pyrophosphatase YjhB (NUDIX family)
MIKQCDNKSVGVILSNDKGEVLLIDRAKFPFGLAAPAGHVDNHGTLEQTAISEVQEEVGIEIEISSLVKVIDKRRIDNKCRRPGGDFHDWTIFTAQTVSTEINRSQDETLGAKWYSKEELREIAQNTKQQNSESLKVFENIWLDFLVELNFLD